MNNKKIESLATPTDNLGAANKLYVDSEIAKIQPSSNTLLIDGSRSMTGDLDMGDNFIDNC